jgi:flavin reductase (DIM6/NTAB) family NADH-FMN oxidoreductase RutF
MIESIRVENSTKNGSAFDARRFRNALGRFASGVAVVTVRHGDHPHGTTVNSFTSVSLDPPLILVSLDNRSVMHGILPSVGRYGVSVLAHDQEPLSNHFAGRTVEKLDLRFVHHGGIPLLEDAVAHFVVEIVDTHPAGDHTLYIGRVEHFECREGKPLLFYAGRYGQLHVEKAPPAGAWQDEFSLFSIGAFDPPIP